MMQSNEVSGSRGFRIVADLSDASSFFMALGSDYACLCLAAFP